MIDGRDAAWWGREADRQVAEIQAKYGVPDFPMEHLMRTMIIAGRMEALENHQKRSAGFLRRIASLL